MMYIYLYFIRRLSKNEDAESKPSVTSKSNEVPPIWKKKMSTWFQRWDADNDGKLTRADFEIFSERMEEVTAMTQTSTIFYCLFSIDLKRKIVK